MLGKRQASFVDGRCEHVEAQAQAACSGVEHLVAAVELPEETVQGGLVEEAEEVEPVDHLGHLDHQACGVPHSAPFVAARIVG